VFIGAGKHAEIWSEVNWNEKQRELEATMLDTLIDLGF